MVICRYTRKNIMVECITLKDSITTTKNNDLSNLEIEDNSKIIIDSYN